MRKLLLLAFAVLSCLGIRTEAREFTHNTIVAYRELHFPGEQMLGGSIDINNYDYIDYIVQIDHDRSTIHVFHDPYNRVSGEPLRKGETLHFAAYPGWWQILGDNGQPHRFQVSGGYNQTTILNFIPEGDPRRRIMGVQLYEQQSGGSTIMRWAERDPEDWPPDVNINPRPVPEPRPHPRPRPHPPRPAPNPNPYEPDDPWPWPPTPAPNPNPYEPDDPWPNPPRPAPNPNPYEPDDPYPYPPYPAPNPNPYEPDDPGMISPGSSLTPDAGDDGTAAPGFFGGGEE